MLCASSVLYAVAIHAQGVSLQEDPLAGGSSTSGGTNVFGAAAAGFGQVQKAVTGFGQSQQAAGAADEDYDVVEISEDQPAPAVASTSKV